MGGRCFYVDFTHCLFVFWMDMNGANLFTCYYNISVEVLPICIALAKVSSGNFGSFKCHGFHFSGHKVYKRSYMAFVLKLLPF